MNKSQLQQAIKSLPLLYGPQLPFSWQGRRMELRQMILNHNPDKFLTWPVITSTMITDPEYQNYHLDLWESKTGLQIKDLNSIVEFGGGYGAMVECCHNRGFSGRYYNYDFPEMIALQEFYLSQKSIPIPESITNSRINDLFIAINSFDETDYETRSNFFRDQGFDHCLVRYNYIWDGIDNYKYFSRFDGEHWNDEIKPNHWYWIK